MVVCPHDFCGIFGASYDKITGKILDNLSLLIPLSPSLLAHRTKIFDYTADASAFVQRKRSFLYRTGPAHLFRNYQWAATLHDTCYQDILLSAKTCKKRAPIGALFTRYWQRPISARVLSSRNLPTPHLTYPPVHQGKLRVFPPPSLFLRKLRCDPL